MISTSTWINMGRIEIMTFAEWVSAGAAFGIKAFFAVVVFLLCCAAVFGVVAALASVIGGREE